jgi:CheY-like chemotaxis protein
MVPDLIVSDLEMPRIDGVAFCVALRADETTRRVPIGNARGSRADRAERAGRAGARSHRYDAAAAAGRAALNVSSPLATPTSTVSPSRKPPSSTFSARGSSSRR